MRGIFRKKWRMALAVAGICVLFAAGHAGYRALHVWRIMTDFEDRIRYLVETGQTIGEKPAAEAFSVDYLQSIFGDNPELLDQLKAVVQRGLAEDPSLTAGEVAAIVVTYHLLEDGNIGNVVVHAIGGFPAARKKPGFHRHGYFFQQIDNNLWTYGNVAIGFLGRDVIMFGADEAVTERQRELLDSVFSGEITLLVQHLERPLYYTIVLPDPQKIVPSQLRNHVQAIVFKGYLGHLDGRWEGLILTPSVRSAHYTLGIISDMKKAGEMALRTKWEGAPYRTEWGTDSYDWWALEMVKTMEQSTLEKEYSIVRMRATFERVMINAILKSIERMSRDLAAMRGIEDERLDPRLVDARLRTRHPLHYWSEEHQWGPDWPVPPPKTNEVPVTVLEPEAEASLLPPGASAAEPRPQEQ